MRARRSALYRAIRALAYVLGSWTVAAAAVPVDLEGAAGTAWSEAQTRQTHSIIENSPVYKELLAETKQLFAQPSFSEYTPFPIVRLYGDTVYGFDEHGFYFTTWRRFLAGALPRAPAFLMSTMAAVQPGVWFPRPWENLQCLPLAPARCELTLSSGGLDKVYYREADLSANALVKDGFALPQSRSLFGWIDTNTALVASDLDDANLLPSGWPRRVRLWHRGEPVASARIVFEGAKTDELLEPWIAQDGGHALAFIVREVSAPDHAELYSMNGAGQNVRIAAPERFEPLGVLHGELILRTGADWTAGPFHSHAGDVIALELAAARAGETHGQILYHPDAREAVGTNSTAVGAGVTSGAVYLTVFDERVASIRRFELRNGVWRNQRLLLPHDGVATLQALDASQDHVLIAWQGLLQPPRLYAYDGGNLRLLRTTPALFEASADTVERKTALSTDGTAIPYWVIRPVGAPKDGTTPTILYGYGAFQSATLPEYLPIVGRLWLQRGGAYVIANVRGEGEFGPQWEAAAGGIHKQRSFDDFAAVARAIERDGLADPMHLGAFGRSAGGLLVAATALQNPGLFRAVVPEDPLVDILYQYDRVAHSSYLSEFGDLSAPAVRSAVMNYSPAEIVHADARQSEFLIVSHRNDQRVSAIGARRFQDRLEAAHVHSHLFEAPEGDHGTVSPENTASSMRSSRKPWGCAETSPMAASASSSVPSDAAGPADEKSPKAGTEDQDVGHMFVRGGDVPVVPLGQS